MDDFTIPGIGVNPRILWGSPMSARSGVASVLVTGILSMGPVFEEVVQGAVDFSCELWIPGCNLDGV